MTTHQVLDSTGAASATVDVDEHGGVIFRTTGVPVSETRFMSVAEVLDRVHALGGTIPDLEAP